MSRFKFLPKFCRTAWWRHLSALLLLLVFADHFCVDATPGVHAPGPESRRLTTGLKPGFLTWKFEVSIGGSLLRTALIREGIGKCARYKFKASNLKYFVHSIRMSVIIRVIGAALLPIYHIIIIQSSLILCLTIALEVKGLVHLQCSNVGAKISGM